MFHNAMRPMCSLFFYFLLIWEYGASLTQRPIRELLHQPHVIGDGEDVEVVEEDVHHQDDPQVQQGLCGYTPQLPVLAAQLGAVGLGKGEEVSYTRYRSALELWPSWFTSWAGGN